MPSIGFIKILIFILVTFALMYLTRVSMNSFKSHGFYRLFAWETILILILLNIDHWFENPFNLPQLISWFCLALSLFLVAHGVWQLLFAGKPDLTRQDPSLLGFEKTTSLITSGAYRYIRHPLYSSLLFLAWGVFFKSFSLASGCLVVVATVFLIATARIEEDENIAYFGEIYQQYIKRTKMFIPLIF